MAAHLTVGHTTALRAIGIRLREQGHAVGFCLASARLPFADRMPEPIRAATQLPATITREGLELLPLSPAVSALWHGARLAGKTGYAELEGALALFTSGMTRQARQIADHARRWRADVVVVDYLMPAGMLGAELAALPFAAIYHSALPFPAAGAAPFGSGLADDAPRGPEWSRAEATLQSLSDSFDRRVARAAHKLGLPAPRSALLGKPLSPDLNLLTTVPALEPGLVPLDGPIVMTGPCLPRISDTDRDDPALHALGDETPRIYVSLGTVFNAQPKVFETILDGIALGEARVVVSAGASFERLASRAGPSVHVFRRVPQVALLSQVDLVITHGGNNTVQECLAAGRPMIVIPFGGDQIANARRVERLGAGVALMPDQLSAARIRDAIDAVHVPACVARAKSLGASLAGLDGAATAASAILALVAARQRTVAAAPSGA